MEEVLILMMSLVEQKTLFGGFCDNRTLKAISFSEHKKGFQGQEDITKYK